MAYSTLYTFTFPPSLPLLFQHHKHKPYSLSPKLTFTPTTLNPHILRNNNMMQSSRVSSVQDVVGGAMAIVQSSPATWQSSLLSNLLIFVLGSPILVTGLSFEGIVAAFLLGTLTWRAFGGDGFLLVATYFIIVSSILLLFMVLFVLKVMKFDWKKLIFVGVMWDLGNGSGDFG